MRETKSQTPHQGRCLNSVQTRRNAQVTMITWIRTAFPENKNTGLRWEGLENKNLTTVKCKINLLLVFLELVLPNSGCNLLTSPHAPCIFILKPFLRKSLHWVSFEV